MYSLGKQNYTAGALARPFFLPNGRKNNNEAVLRMKDSTMETVSKVQEQAGDILADAKAINEARAVEAEAAVIEDAAEETTEETAE